MGLEVSKKVWGGGGSTENLGVEVMVEGGMMFIAENFYGVWMEGWWI